MFVPRCILQVHYTIQRPQPPKQTAAKGRGTRGATAKQRQQAQQPDGSEVVSFVTQVRDYSSEQQELISTLLREAGVDMQAVQPQQQHAAQVKQEQVVQPQQQGHAVSAGQAAEAPAGPSDLAVEAAAGNSTKSGAAVAAERAADDVNGGSHGGEDAAAAVPVVIELSGCMPSQHDGNSNGDADADAGSVEGLEATVEGLEVTAGQHAAACEHDGNDRPSKRAKQDDEMV